MSAGEDQSDKPAGDSITLGNEKQAIEVLAQSIQGLWEVVNNLTRLRPTKRLDFRVPIFGSARVRVTIGFTLRFAISPKNWGRWGVASLPAEDRG